MKLVPLGTNGFFPTYGRQTMSFLLVERGRAALLDAGTGTGRLVEPAVRAHLGEIEELDILLTHYHLDHTAGLTYLSSAWGRPVRVWAPAPPLVDATPEQALARLVGPPLFPITLDRYPTPVTVRTYREPFELLGHPLALRRQQHPGGSVGVRLGPLAYVTDTAADPETVAFARGARLLLHEVWLSDTEGERQPRQLTGHAAASAVLRIAEAAEVGALAPVHHHPTRDPQRLAELLAQMRAASKVEIVELVEGECLEIVAS